MGYSYLGFYLLFNLFYTRVLGKIKCKSRGFHIPTKNYFYGNPNRSLNAIAFVMATAHDQEICQNCGKKL